MAAPKLVSANSIILNAAWPQLMTVTLTFDQAIFTTDDFLIYFGGDTAGQPGAMTAPVSPLRADIREISFQFQVSPWASGRMGCLGFRGAITNVVGQDANLFIGEDYNFYNTTFFPIFREPRLILPWPSPEVLPNSSVCPDNFNPAFEFDAYPHDLRVVGYDTENPSERMWAGGDFFFWVNFTFKPDLSESGIPFVWEPPFYYAWSMYGYGLINTTTPPIPPIAPEMGSVKFNVCSSGNSEQWDTCGWIEDYTNWRGKVQMWIFGSDIFEGDVPWQYPAIAQPTGDLSPDAVFGFSGAGVPLQVYKEQNFTYRNP